VLLVDTQENAWHDREGKNRYNVPSALALKETDVEVKGLGRGCDMGQAKD
jgi:hypothetical protein